MNDERPEWTNDWAVHNHPLWRKHLTRFRDVPCEALEIGSCEGRSSCFFVQNILTHPQSHLTCVDPWVMGTEERFHKNARILGCTEKITAIKAFSNEVDLAQKPWDFIYVDGSHVGKDCLFDMVRSWVSLKRGGIMIVDDYLWNLDNPAMKFLKPKHAVDAFTLLMERDCTILHVGYQVVLQKP